MLKRSLILCFTILSTFFSVAQDNNILFSENKGQWPHNVAFRAQLYEGYIYAEKNCLTYQFYNPNDIKHTHAGLEIDTSIIPEQFKKTSLKHFDNHNHKKDETVHFHAYQVFFNNMNKNVQPYGVEMDGGIENYYLGNDPSKWGTNVHSYHKIIYENIYKNIDLKLYNSFGGLKYDFIVKPGGKPQKISLTYSGVRKISINNTGDLVIKTSVNDVYEFKPFAYQIIHNDTIEIPCSYSINEFTLTYNVSSYNKDYTLYIDPELIFSTYTGATSDNWGFTATYDNANNVYAGGIVIGSGYPVTIGAYQQNYVGNWDIGIIKYDPTGTTRLYATFLGGDLAEMPHSLIVNSNNELLILGTTGSDNFPTSNAYDNTFNGGQSITYDGSLSFTNGSDIFIAKLSPDGSSLLASTFLGGTENDGINYDNEPDLYYGSGYLYYNYGDGARGEIMVDVDDNVYIASTTFSQDYPVVNAAQPTSGGSQEGVVSRFDPTLTTLEWSTYIGGTDKDAAYSIDVDLDDGAYISGGTCSPDLLLPMNGFMTTRAGGTVDAFVIKLDKNTGTYLNGTYFGSSQYDQAYFVRVNQAKKVFIFGQTTAPGNTLIYNAKYNHPNSGQFLASFSNDLSTLNWSTVFGTGINTPNISPTAFEVDICNRIYLAGCGREWPQALSWDWIPSKGYYELIFNWPSIQGTNGMEVSPDAEYSTTDGKDFYFMVIDDEANQLDYATFFGEQHSGTRYTYDFIDFFDTGCISSGRDHVDGGTSRFDSQGYIYQSVCASCGQCQGFPVKPNPGAWSVSNNSSNCNNAVLRFYIDFGLLNADFELPEVTCGSKELEFVNTTQVMYSDPHLIYTWDFGDGSPLSDEESPKHTFTNPGVYEIKLIVEDSSACNEKDSIMKKLEIVVDKNYDTLNTKNICEGETTSIGIPNAIDPNLTYIWKPSTALADPNSPQTDATPNETTEYQLTVADGFCETEYVQTVEVHKNDYTITNIEVTANGNNTNPTCYGEKVTLNAVTNNDTYKYTWSYSDTFWPVINNDFTQSSITINAENTLRFYVKAHSTYCEFEDTASVKLVVSKNFITVEEGDTICAGDYTSLQATNLIPSNTLNYTWQPQAYVALGQGTDNPLVNPDVSTKFIVYATNQDGCTTTDTVFVFVDEMRIDASSFKQISCYGDTDGQIFINPVGFAPYTINWDDGSNSLYRFNLSEGLYTVTITDSLNCTNTVAFNIIEPDSLQIADTTNSFVTCDIACNGSILVDVIGGTEPYIYHWSNGSDSTSALTKGLCQGVYSVTVEDDHGCIAPLNANVTIGVFEKLPYLNAYGSPTNLYLGQSSILYASELPDDSVEYRWNPYIWIEPQKGASTTATPQDNIEYYVTATDQYGCVNTDTVALTVNEWYCGHPFVFVPTGFSPNGDGVNDVFQIKSGVVTELTFEIYDRWGELVWQTNDVSKTWDGFYNGKPLEPQVFVYYITATCLNNEKFTEEGNITILK